MRLRQQLKPVEVNDGIARDNAVRIALDFLRGFSRAARTKQFARARLIHNAGSPEIRQPHVLSPEGGFDISGQSDSSNNP